MEFFNTVVSDAGRALVLEVLNSGWISEGAMNRRFEEELELAFGIRNVVTVNSGTAALHLALALAGIGPGDEVILPAQTFVATGLAVMMQRATPVFCDIDAHTGNIDVESCRSKITTRTKALMPVHWGGYPCDMAELNNLAREFELAVVEDAAHALGATYKGQPIGSVSRFTAFSFQAIKHVTTGDGGALCCADDRDARDGRTRRWFGIDRATSQPSILGERIYDISELGFKYHMNDLAAALGLGNLRTFPDRLVRRRAIGSRYRRELSSVAGVELLRSELDREHAYWLFTMLADRRDDFIRKLAEKGIPSSVVHQRIDRNSVFGGLTRDLVGQEEFDRRQIAIPVHEALSDDDVDFVISTIREGW